MSRLLVLGRSDLTLWRRDRLLRSWSVADLGADWRPDLVGCDGVSLLVLSGSVHTNPLRVPDLTGSDRRRFLAQQAAQQTAGSCGGLVDLEGLIAVQRIDGAAGLDVLLTRLQERGCRLRRVRHVAQLAEVVFGCLHILPEQGLLGWTADEGVHFSAVRDGVVLWHRVLLHDSDLELAFRETAQHMVEHGLFDESVSVARIWLAQREPVPSTVDRAISLHEFELALRRSAASADTLMVPSELAGVLASARSEFKTLPMKTAWRRQTALRGLACASGLSCALSLTLLWRAESAHAAYVAATARDAQVASLVIPPYQPDARFDLHQFTAKDGARPWRDWQRAVRAVALAMTQVPALTLMRIDWAVEQPTQQARFRVVLRHAAQTDASALSEAFVAALAQEHWEVVTDERPTQVHTDAADSREIELLFSEQTQDDD